MNDTTRPPAGTAGKCLPCVAYGHNDNCGFCGGTGQAVYDGTELATYREFPDGSVRASIPEEK